MRKLHGHLRAAREAAVAATMPAPREPALRPHAGDLDAELDEAAQVRRRGAPWRPAVWVAWELTTTTSLFRRASTCCSPGAVGCRRVTHSTCSSSCLRLHGCHISEAVGAQGGRAGMCACTTCCSPSRCAKSGL